MERIFRFFAERHMLANIFVVMAILGGTGSALTVKRDLLPIASLPRAGIMTFYPGASPQDVELNVTGPIEESLNGVTGIDRVSSLSAEGVSSISIEMDPDLNERETDRVVQEIRDAVDRIPDLPAEITDRPLVKKMKTGDIPVIQVGISSDTLSYAGVREAGMDFEKRLKRLPGVSRYDRYGFLEREVKILVYPEKIRLYQITMNDIISAVRKRNIRGTSGTVETYTMSENIVTLSQFNSPEEVADVIVRTTFSGPAVRVRDVARVTDTFEKETVISKINGRKVISYSVYKKDQADIVRTVERIRNLIEREKRSNSSLDFHTANDMSRYIESSYGIVKKNGITGFILVVIILTVFLRFRISLWVAVGIPVSLFGTLIIMPLFGCYLDVISLSAMILVIGIIVDDAIIISESIYSRWEQGDPPVEAAVNGLKNVFWPVMTTVATTFMAFLPMFLIPGTTGKFIYSIPLVVTLAISCSLLEGIIALPSHVSRSLPRKRGRERVKTFPFRAAFVRLLKSALRFRYAVIAIFILIWFVTLAAAVNFLEFEFFPKKGAQSFDIELETPIGTPLRITDGRVRKVEELVSRIPASELASFTTLTGTRPMSIEQEHFAAIRVNLTPYAERVREAQAIADELREKIMSVKGFSRVVFDVRAAGPSPEKPVSVRVSGNDDETRKKFTDDIVAFMKSTDGVVDITRDDDIGKKQVRLVPDYELLARTGLSVYDVARNLRMFFEGEEVTRVQYGREDVEFTASLNVEPGSGSRFLGRIYIPNQSGNLVPLKSLARMVSGTGESAYRHIDGERVTTVEADVEDGKITVHRLNSLLAEKFGDGSGYPGMELVFEGEEVNRKESIKSFVTTFVLAMLGIYFLLMLLFNSPLQPFIVLSSVPFAVYGVMLAFMVHGEPVSFMGLMGVIGLCGVAVNDSLVMVNHLNSVDPDMNEDGDGRNSLIAEGAADRLRPVVLTTITTAAGILPLAYGIGGADPVNAPMALALGWGLVLATPLTLFVMPCLYAVSHDARFALKKAEAGARALLKL